MKKNNMRIKDTKATKADVTTKATKTTKNDVTTKATKTTKNDVTTKDTKAVVIARGPELVRKIAVTVNGRKYVRSIPAHRSLLHFIRDDISLTGTKEGCGAGECGACTVLMNGKAINSCLVLAVEADNAVIQTIEGEAVDGVMTPLQEAFHRHHAVQCGFCTPGMLMSLRALLQSEAKPTVMEIKEAIEGNFCRCTGYQQIIEAVLDTTGQSTKKEELRRA